MISTPFAPANGFSLIEVLVASAIFGFAAVALAHLQLRTIQLSHEAQTSAIARLAVQDIKERILLNAAGRRTGLYDRVDISEPQKGYYRCDGGNGCSAIQLANFDINEWVSTLQQQLGVVRASIEASIRGYEITVRWDDNRDGQLPSECPLSASAAPINDMGCYHLTVVMAAD